MTSCATVAVCTYNRAARLPALARALRAQQSPIPFEILFVDNNSTDATPEVLDRLAAEPGFPIRVVREPEQGIVPARNRAIAESLDSDYLLFLDDDETPRPGWLSAALDALDREQADCVGGPIVVDFSEARRPHWLTDELVGFLGAVDHGPDPFWIRDRSTPVWSGNVGYRTALFRHDGTLRFDKRYNRKGSEVGGGEDALMFRRLLEANARIRYRPEMVIEHHVERWRLRRRYFVRLHYRSGYRRGAYEMNDVQTVPRWLVRQAAVQVLRAGGRYLRLRPDALRQAMNAAHALGMLHGILAANSTRTLAPRNRTQR